MTSFIKKSDFEKLVLKKHNKFIIIFFKAGTAGSALLRILISHNELYHSFKNLGQLEYDDPLKYPDSVAGFGVHLDLLHRLPYKEQHLACVHLDFHTPWNAHEDFREYFKLIKQGETIVLKTHNFDLYEKFKKCKCIYILEDKPLDRASINKKDGFHPAIPEGVFVVNINKLMSENYNTFLKEYLKIVYEFDLSPRINSVRSFILMWLERQKRLKRSLS